MEADFWHERWKKNEIGFHVNEANPLLVKYFSELLLDKGGRVFVPLCGKTLDIGWLLANGNRVVGAELSELAIEELFEGLGIAPTITELGHVKRYSAHDVEIFAGDFFALSSADLGTVDGVYDRAALVALPEDMRPNYRQHLMEITGKAPQLLINYAYDQSLMKGPPFSVTVDEVISGYEDHYELTQIASVRVPGRLKGKCEATEYVWLLKNK